MTPWPCSPAATRKTSLSVAASYSAMEAAWASNRVTVASTIDRRTASPPLGSRRRAASTRSPMASSAATASGPSRRRDAGSLTERRRSPLGCASEAVEIRDDDGVLFLADQALIGEIREQPVHRLARAADHRRKVGLRVRPRQRDLAD